MLLSHTHRRCRVICHIEIPLVTTATGLLSSTQFHTEQKKRGNCCSVMRKTMKTCSQYRSSELSLLLLLLVVLCGLLHQRFFTACTLNAQHHELYSRIVCAEDVDWFFIRFVLEIAKIIFVLARRRSFSSVL